MITLAQNTDIEQIQNAVNAIANAHAALRTRIFIQGNEVRQRISDNELICETQAISESEITAVKSAFVKPFELFEQQLFRVKICKTEQNVYLLLDFHHIIFDGASLNIFLQELTDFGGISEWSEIKAEDFTSFDSALLELKQKDTAEYKSAKDFFDKMMKEGEGATSIPFDNDSKEVGVPETVSVKVRKSNLALDNIQVTSANLFLGAAGFVTSRFANTKKVGIAAVSSGRDSVRLKNTMGMFVKTLPVILDVDSSKTSAEYLDCVQEVMYGAMSNEIYPFTQIVTEYDFRPQILFAYQVGLVNSRFGIEELALDVLKFPVELIIEEDDSDYSINVKYDSAKFDKQTMETYAECISNIVTLLASKKEKTLSEISITNDRQMKIINSFSAEFEPIPANTIHEMFEEQAAMNPNAPAVDAVDVSLNYSQLNERANRIAHALIEHGVEKGDIVAVMLPRNSHVFTSIYGILKAGGSFIPVDPSYPTERVAHIISDSEAKFIITDGENSKHDYENCLNIESLLQNKNTNNPNLPITAEDMSYVIYTSGTTGKPKGNMLTHGGAVNLASNSERNTVVYENVRLNSTFLSVSTISFDAFAVGVFVPLSHGLKTVIASEEEARNPILLAKLCEKTGADTICATSSVYSQYLESAEMRAAFAKFSLIFQGGEKFPAWLYADLRKLSNAVLINAYGPYYFEQQ
jgi:non-ribosomal peptide synthetase component F